MHHRRFLVQLRQFASNSPKAAEPISQTNTQLKQDRIRETVTSCLRKLTLTDKVQADSELAQIALDSDSQLKFQLMNEVSAVLERPVVNTELNDIKTAEDVVRVMMRPRFQTMQERQKTVREVLAGKQLPPNMRFVKSTYKLEPLRETKSK